MIELISSLANDERFHFVFIGDGVKRPLLQQAIDERGLTNLTLLDPRPRSEQIEFLNACDVGLVSLVKKMYGAAMPSKTYNIMAAGKPIVAITDEGSELSIVIDENTIGWRVEPGHADQLKNILEDVYNRRSELEMIGMRARSEAERNYSLPLAIERYKEALA
jgi:glycosyltransferase involved in cell wall biosynthesis